jgi:hypothetical protein
MLEGRCKPFPKNEHDQHHRKGIDVVAEPSRGAALAAHKRTLNRIDFTEGLHGIVAC